MVKIFNDHVHETVWGFKPTRIIRPSVMREIKQNLAPFDIDFDKDDTEVINMPFKKGTPTGEEAINIAYSKWGKLHFHRLDKLLRCTPQRPPEMPSLPGWSRFEDGQWLPIDMPQPKGALVLDFETVPVVTCPTAKHLNQNTWMPVVCCAFDGYHWYCWLVDWDNPVQVVPFGKNITVVGWNISYDRAYLNSEYSINTKDPNRFFCCMSALIPVRGMCNQQRPIYMKLKKNPHSRKPRWFHEACTHGLDAAYEHYTGRILNKGVRDELIKDGAKYAKPNMHLVYKYCADDILATLTVFKSLYPEWLDTFPNKYSRLSTLLMNSYQVFLNKDRFPGHYDRCEEYYQKQMVEVQNHLMDAVVDVLNNPTEHQKEHLDWTLATTGATAGIPKWARDVIHIDKKFSKAEPFQPGDLSTEDVSVKLKKNDKGELKPKLTINTKIAPIILSIAYQGELVYFEGKHETGTWRTASQKLHHPEDEDKRCATIFSKDHAKYFETDEFSSLSIYESVKEIMKITRSVSTWVSMRSRIKTMYTQEDDYGNLIFVDPIVVRGTITGRCASKYTQAQSNRYPDKVGTEFKGYFSCPEGYFIGGYDAPQQEMMISSSYATKKYGVFGADPLNYVSLLGSKENGDDIHTLVSRLAGIARKHGKILNYRVMYFGGVKGSAKFLYVKSPEHTREENDERAASHMRNLRGQRMPGYGMYYGGVGSDTFNLLIELANSPSPRLPVGGVAMSKSLAGCSDFLTTRGNWTVQGLGAVFRDIWLVYGQFFMHFLGVDEAFPAMSIHDEVWFHIPKNKAKKGILALYYAYLYTVAQVAKEFGILQIPAGYGSPPEIVATTWLTKENDHDNTTVTNDVPQILPVTIVPKEIKQWFENPGTVYPIDEWLTNI